jgi:hypothetical protein
MRRIALLTRILGLGAIAIGTIGVPAASAAPLYQVNVTRAADNLYKDSNSGAYIETQLCLEQAYNEQGALNYPGPTTQGTLYFSQSGRQCTVVRVLQDGAPVPLTHDQQIEAAAESMGWIRNAWADNASSRRPELHTDAAEHLQPAGRRVRWELRSYAVQSAELLQRRILGDAMNRALVPKVQALGDLNAGAAAVLNPHGQCRYSTPVHEPQMRLDGCTSLDVSQSLRKRPRVRYVTQSTLASILGASRINRWESGGLTVPPFLHLALERLNEWSPGSTDRLPRLGRTA